MRWIARTGSYIVLQVALDSKRLIYKVKKPGHCDDPHFKDNLLYIFKTYWIMKKKKYTYTYISGMRFTEISIAFI